MATKPDDLPMLALIETPDIPAPTLSDQARIVLLDGERFDAFYERMKAETDKHVADVSTDKGRKAVIALARRVTTTKTAITAAAKGLTEGWREQTNTVNAARRPIEERLAALAEEVRRPVTEWEQAEAARVERNRVVVQNIYDAGIVQEDDTAITVEQRGRAVHDIRFDPKEWTDAELERAAGAKVATVKALVAARDRLRQEEADRAELEWLRAEAAERAAREAAEQAERNRVAAAERAEREAAAAEQARQREAEAAAERERQRLADAERIAAERARQEVADAAAKAQAERDAEHARQLAAVQAERDRAATAERERVEAERVAQVERDRIAAEDARRAKNRAHVTAVMGEAKLAIMSCGVVEDVAKAIVLSIKAGTVPHVEIRF